MQKMYDFFRENHNNPPSIKMYSQKFHKLQLSFKKPRVDTCFICEKFKMKIQLAKDEQEKADQVSQHEHHKMLGDQAYEEK